MDRADLSNSPALVLTLLVLAAVVAHTGTDPRRLITGRNVVLLGIGSWFLLEPVMLPVALGEYSQDEYTSGILIVAAAAVSFLIGYHRTAGCPVFPRLGAAVRRLDAPVFLWRVVAAGAVIGFAPIVYFTGTDLITKFDSLFGMRESWGGILSRGRYGDARAAFLQLEMFVIGVSPFAAVLLADRRSGFLKRLLSVPIIVWPILRGFGTGTRSAMLMAVAPVLMVVYLKVGAATQKRLLIGGLMLAPLGYQLMAAVVASRVQGEFDWQLKDRASYVGNEMFRELLFIRRTVNNGGEYLYGYSYYVQLVNPIPRFLWSGKPTAETGLLMAKMYGMVDERSGEAMLTVSPGLIGEMYLNFGLMGVVGLSAFGGWLVRGWDLIAERNGSSEVVMVYYVGGLAVLFFLGRSFFLNTFYALISFAFLAWMVGRSRAVCRMPA